MTINPLKKALSLMKPAYLQQWSISSNYQRQESDTHYNDYTSFHDRLHIYNYHINQVFSYYTNRYHNTILLLANILFFNLSSSYLLL